VGGWVGECMCVPATIHRGVDGSGCRWGSGWVWMWLWQWVGVEVYVKADTTPPPLSFPRLRPPLGGWLCGRPLGG